MNEQNPSAAWLSLTFYVEMIILNLEIEHKEILETKVQFTIGGKKIVYQAE